MSAKMTAVLFFSLGVFAMSPDVLTADDKKDEKFPEKVTYKKWVVQGVGGKEKFFLPDHEVSAKFIEIKDRQVWRLKTADVVGGDPTIGSEITSTDKDGNKTTWIVTKAQNGEGLYICDCKKKEAKKD